MNSTGIEWVPALNLLIAAWLVAQAIVNVRKALALGCVSEAIEPEVRILLKEFFAPKYVMLSAIYAAGALVIVALTVFLW